MEAAPRTEEAARRADALAVSLRGALDRITAPLARAAAGFVEGEGWAPFGYARLDDHARERFGRSGRWVRDLAVLGRIFSTLPGLEAAIRGADGGPPLGRVSGLLIGRIATEDSVSSWVRLARCVSIRELKEAIVAARAEGSVWPSDSPEAQAAVESDTESESGGASESREGDVPRSLVRLAVPRAVVAAFDETLDLFRAVEGNEATVTSFVEALVAEAAASSGDAASAVDGAGRESLTHGETVAAAERAFAHSTRHWEHLPETGRSEWAMRLAGTSLERLAELEQSSGQENATELDGRISALVALEDEIESRLGLLLMAMTEDRAWSRLRFASAVHYAEQRLGLRRTAARMRVRAARAVRRLPVVRRAYERGDIGMEAAWLVSRMIGGAVVDEETQQAWVERARFATIKRLRDEARLAGRVEAGDRSGARVGGEDAKRAPCMPVSDDAWLASLRRAAGTARHRVGILGEIAAAKALRGSDVFLRLRLPDDLAEDLLATIEVARRALESRVAQVPWEEAWPEPDPPGSVQAAREFFIRCRRAPAWVGVLAILEDFVATWDAPAAVSRRSGQPIFVRDGWRCVAPGCTSRRNLEEHHVRYRSRGGGDEVSNRITLCRFHHQRGEHGGLARCRGRAPLDLIWSLGRKGQGGMFRNELCVR